MTLSRRPLMALAPVVFGASVLACSAAASSSSTTDPALIAARNDAQSSYAQSIDDTDDRYEHCLEDLESTGKCEISDATNAHQLTIVVDLLIAPQGILQKARALIGQLRQALSDAKTKMCETVAPFAGLQHPLFFYGGSVTLARGVAAQQGYDVVFDLVNQQAAVFTYDGVGIASLAGGEASAYAGYGFGNKPNVVDAWSGRFCSASASVSLLDGPLLGIPASAGVGASAFASPDQSVVGGAVTVSGDLGFTPPVLSGAAFVGDWTAYDEATTELGNAGFGYSDSMQKDPTTGKSFVQYGGAIDMAISLLWNLPFPVNVAIATQTLALSALRETGLTIEQACPKEVANRKPIHFDVLDKACGALGPIQAPGATSSSGGTDALSKTDCNDKADGWWCLDVAGGQPWMAYCQGKQIAGGCGCASCSASGVKAGCTADAPPAACPSN